MLHNFRLLFVTIATSVLLVACSGGTNEDASVNQTVTGSVAISSAGETDKVNPEDFSDRSDADNNEAISEPTEVVEEEGTGEVAEEVEVVHDEMEPMVILALEKIVGTVGIDKDAHTFLFNEYEDFIEVEVREKKADGAAPLIGKYRYQLENEKVLTMDYLTGEYIPHEDSE